MATRGRAAILVALSCIAIALCAAGLSAIGPRPPRRILPPPHIAMYPERISADGYDAALLSIETTGESTGEPHISLSDTTHGVRIEEAVSDNGKWQSHIRAGVMPGRIQVTVETPGHLPATAGLELTLAPNDRSEDGTPDFLRLGDERDRQAFRRWFTYLAEAQYFQDPAARPAEIDDCAALIRYAYREALHAHDGAWAESAKLPIVPAFEPVAKYQYPYTPLGAALFRVQPGPFHPADLAQDAFRQFADAQTLWRFNTHFLSRDLARALPGDLIFFRQESGHTTFHSMIYLGASQLRPDGHRYLLYHTGPDGAGPHGNPGEMRRLTVEELNHFPQPEWRPLASNPSFLGVARWSILWTEASEGRRTE